MSAAQLPASFPAAWRDGCVRDGCLRTTAAHRRGTPPAALTPHANWAETATATRGPSPRMSEVVAGPPATRPFPQSPRCSPIVLSRGLSAGFLCAVFCCMGSCGKDFEKIAENTDFPKRLRPPNMCRFSTARRREGAGAEAYTFWDKSCILGKIRNFAPQIHGIPCGLEAKWLRTRDTCFVTAFTRTAL